MVNFAGEEDAADVRHNTPYAPSLQDVAENAGMPREEFERTHLRMVHSFTDERARQGLSFGHPNGLVSIDLGRWGQPEAETLHTLDLRVMLAHLDSAASAVKAELDRRYR